MNRQRPVTRRRILLEAFKLLYRRIPYIAIASISLYLLIFIGVRGYYRYMPASWFVTVQGTPHIDNGPVNGTLTLTFCRNTRYPNIVAVGARSYYVLLDGKETPAGNYSFKATIEHNKRCQYIPIAPSNHPEKAGTYLAHTDLTFSVEGHRKVVSYDTNTFVLSDTRQSLEDQIKSLQEQIQLLESEQSILPTPSQPAGQNSPVATTTAPPDSPAPTPSTPVPTAPSQAGSTVEGPAGIVQSTLNGLSGILKRLF